MGSAPRSMAVQHQQPATHQKGIVMMYSNNQALQHIIVVERHEQLRRSAATSRLRREARRDRRQRARSR